MSREITTHQDIDKQKDELNSHFGDEIKCKKRIHELEQKMETAALSALNKKTELAQIIKDKGKDSI